MKKLYYYPPATGSGYSNPYSVQYKQELASFFCVLDDENKPAKILGLSFFLYSFLADYYIINWLENIPFSRLGTIQYALVYMGLKVIKWRKKHMIWMAHNIHPHQGDCLRSRRLQEILMNQADCVISHSQEAAAFFRKRTNKEVVYMCHPVSQMELVTHDMQTKEYDVLIWGSILPYKGVVEFLQSDEVSQSDVKVYILGQCKDAGLAQKIERCCNSRVVFENRRASFEEIAMAIASSRYVLFPYVGSCVSSSGALMDTLMMRGVPVGPKVGAFVDLEAEGVCVTYYGYSDLVELLQKPSPIQMTQIDGFIHNHSWKSFAEDVVRHFGVQ